MIRFFYYIALCRRVNIYRRLEESCSILRVEQSGALLSDRLFPKIDMKGHELFTQRQI